MSDRPAIRVYDPFYIQVSHVAAPFPPSEALPFLQRHADRLGIAVHCDINGHVVMASPGEVEPVVVPPFPKQVNQP